jgi:hypothetical protein
MPDRGQGFGPGPNHLGPGPHHQHGPGGAALRAIADVPTSSPTYLPSTTNEDTQEGTRTTASGTTNQVAPTIPVLNKIQPSNANATDPRPPKPKRIIVPQKSCNGGFDFKFDADPQNVNLLDLLSPQDYTDAITTLNETTKKSRSTKLDASLLVTGPLLVPLAAWGIRHFAQTKRRKKLLVLGINHFNDLHPTLYMRWNHAISGSFLSIQPRPHNESHEDTTNMIRMSLLTGLEDSNVLV